MKKYIAGLYFRLSQEDERQGESLSIDNQRHILRNYAEENGFEIYDEYIDDGVSGTTFDRPQVQRLLDDAKTGVINTILVKDLSRFGRNYIEVGQYVDYVFPAFGMKGKMPEDICVEFIQKYSDEKKTLAEEIVVLEAKLTETETKQQSADDFIRNIKKYLNAPELTREMCYELLDRVVVGGLPKITGKERQIDIVYKVDISSVIRYKFQK